MKRLFGIALCLVLITAKTIEWNELICSIGSYRVNISHCHESLPSSYYVSQCLWLSSTSTAGDFIFVQRIGQGSRISLCHLFSILKNHIDFHLRVTLDYSRLENLYRQQNNTENNAHYSLLFPNKSLTEVSHKHLVCLLPSLEFLALFGLEKFTLRKINECGPNNICCSNLKFLRIEGIDLRGEQLLQGLRSLSILSLSRCFLTVKNLSLTHLNNLTTLLLVEIGLISLDLSWLPVSLKYLNLSRNPLTTITDTKNRAPAFNLNELYIQRTNIDAMDAVALFPSVESLHVDLITLDQHAFFRTPNVTYLYMNKSLLQHVERFSLSSFENRSSPILIGFENDNLYCHCDQSLDDWECESYGTVFQEITMLNVEHHSTSFCQYVARCPSDQCTYKYNKLYDVQYDCKPKISQWIESVDCGRLYLWELPSNILSTRMTHFYLDGNNFTKVDLDRVLNGSHIKVLFLNASNIERIETQAHGSEDSQCYINDLNELYLQNNHITHIQPKQFHCLTKLRSLNLDGNRIASITSNLFKNLAHLRQVYLQKNQIEYVESSTFANLKELEVIHMEENSLQDSSFGNMLDLRDQNRLKMLDLSINKFRTFPKILICSNHLANPVTGTTNADSVFINNNEIGDVIVTSRAVHLEGNQIELLDKQSLSNLCHVTKLFLNDNKIKLISIHTFEPLVHLEQLYLHRNRLLNPRLWEYGLVRNLTKLTLDQTRFVCECEYIEQLIATGKTMEPLDVSRLNCTTDDTNELYGINEYLVRHCQTSKIMAVSIPLGAVLFIVFIAALFYRYRFEAKVLLYSRFPNRFLKDPTVDESKRWDIFVAYCGADLEFVAQKLHPGLREYRTCFHDRDFVVGAFITDNIIQSIQDSCCTLVVLSNAFIQSAWCQYEFKMAHMKAMQDKCRRLLAMVIEDLDTTNMDEEIAAYLRTKTYLRWSDRLFWSKLYYSLPPGRNKVQNEDILLQELVNG